MWSCAFKDRITLSADAKPHGDFVEARRKDN